MSLTLKRIFLIAFISLSILSCTQKSRNELIIGTWVYNSNFESSGNRIMLFFFEDGSGVYETLIGAKVKTLTEFRYRIRNEGQFIETIDKNGKMTKAIILKLSNEYLKLRGFYDYPDLTLERDSN